MNNVDLYVQNNTLQQHDARECLEMYSKKIHWQDEATIIDIGCGDGLVTTNVLKKYLPALSKLIGCDKCEDMVKFANAFYGSHGTRFIVLDIEGDIPENLRRKFQYAFSFFTLHWTRRPKVVFRNIYDLLDEDGECLLMFLGHNSVYTTYRNLAYKSKWSSWLKDVEQYTSPFHDSQDPVNEIKSIMHAIGFRNVDVEYKEKTFLYDSVDAKMNALRAVNPFKVPEDLFKEFMEDILQELHRIEKTKRNNEDSDSISTFYYNLIYVHAIK